MRNVSESGAANSPFSNFWCSEFKAKTSLSPSLCLVSKSSLLITDVTKEATKSCQVYTSLPVWNISNFLGTNYLPYWRVYSGCLNVRWLYKWKDRTLLRQGKWESCISGTKKDLSITTRQWKEGERVKLVEQSRMKCKGRGKWRLLVLSSLPKMSRNKVYM